MSENEHWTLDKRVPVAGVLAIMIQTGVAIWWASGLDGRVKALEAEKAEVRELIKAERALAAEERNRLWARVTDNERAQQQTAVKLGEIHGTLGGMSKQVNSILYRLEKAIK